jgi:Uma2 family endonuclease
MTPPTTTPTEQAGVVLPDHTQLPCEDGSMNNSQEPPQSELLTGCLLPRLTELHPDGQFYIGQDVGIYWKITQPPLDGCRAPDWFYVPGVPPLLEGKPRRSYVLWQELVHPLLVVEYVSGDGSEERDATPHKGKFWVYEQVVSAAYFAIHDPEKDGGVIELYEHVRGRYRPVPPNAAGRYPIEPLGVELGLWRATYRNIPMAWLRVWDSASGEMIPTEGERAEAERQRAEAAEGLVDDFRREAEQENERAEKERRRAEHALQQAEDEKRRAEDEKKFREEADKRAGKLAERLRSLGVDPDAA